MLLWTDDSQGIPTWDAGLFTPYILLQVVIYWLKKIDHYRRKLLDKIRIILFTAVGMLWWYVQRSKRKVNRKASIVREPFPAHRKRKPTSSLILKTLYMPSL